MSQILSSTSRRLISCISNNNNQRSVLRFTDLASSLSSSCVWQGLRPERPVVSVRHPQQQQHRYKNHAAKKGLHLQRLNEMAHTNERAVAEERRQKKKDKTAVRKHGKSPEASNTKNNEPDVDDDGEHEDDIDDDEEEDNEDGALPDPSAVHRQMQRHVTSFVDYLTSVRSGTPTVALFDGITVADAYGRGTGSVHLSALAQIVLSNNSTLAVATCFDPATAPAVLAAIRDKLELNPQSEEDGTGTIRIPLPRLSLEDRHEIAGSVQKRAEHYRQRIRQNRRKAMDIVKQGVAGKLEGVSKDDAFRIQQDIEDATEKVVQELNAVAEKKHKEIVTV